MISNIDLTTFTSSIGRLAFALIFGLIAWISILAIYRIFLHPLSKFPGPVLAKITDLHNLYYVWRGDSHLHITRCHERYGSVVRLTPNRISFNTAEALPNIYGFKSNVRKADFYNVFQKAFHTLNCIDKQVHASKRRLLGHAFSEKALRSVEDLMISQIEIWSSKLKEASGALNMAKWANYLAFDIMGELAFGKAFQMMEGKHRFVGDILLSAARYNLIVGSKMSIKTWGLDKYLFSQLSANKSAYQAFARSQVVERKRTEVEHRDFYHYLLEAKDENGLGISEMDLFAEANLLIAAGSDTASSALAAAFFYLGRNQKFLQKVADEIRTVFDGKDTASIRTGPALSSCKYLKACIDESMRMSPPVPGFLPRTIMRGGAKVDGYDLPAEVEVGVCFHTIHHNAKYFRDPYTFNPDRWFGPNAEVQKALSAFAPFSIGPRNCIGKRMAEMEMTVILARVLKDFDFTAEGQLGNSLQHDGQYECQDWFVAKKDGPMIRFKSVK